MNMEPLVKAPSPRQSPKSSRKIMVQNEVLLGAPPAEIIQPSPSPKSTQEKNELKVILPSAPIEQIPSPVHVDTMKEKHIPDLVEEEFDQRDSVEAFSNHDSVEQFDRSMILPLSQDRESDLTLEETDQDNLDHSFLNSQTENLPTSAMNILEYQQQQNDENNAFEYLRGICSPTVSYSLQSDQWGHRKEALELIQKYIERNLQNLKLMTETQCCVEFKWFCIILRKYFLDRVAPVYYAAYDCFRSLLKIYTSSHGAFVHGRDIEDVLESMIPPLLSNLGGEMSGTNKRTQKEACRCILRVARLTAVDGLGLILQMFQDTNSPPGGGGPRSSTHVVIAIKQKLILLKILINEFSITELSSTNGNYDSGSGGTSISADLVLSICQVGINHSDDKIRKTAVDIMGLAYQQVGKNIKMFITDIKPAMLKVLEKKFSEIDQMNGTSGSTSGEIPGFASSSSFNRESVTDTTTTKGKSSKKVENIRNLAPVVFSKSVGAGGSSLNGPLGARSLNSSFSGTAMLSSSPDGEENFVVMKSPKKKEQRSQGGLSAPSPSSSLSQEKKSSSRTLNPATVTGNSSSSSMDKENDAHYLSKRVCGGIAVPPGNGNGTGTPNGISKNRFEISDEISFVSASSPMTNRKEKKTSSGKGIKPSQKNVEEDRFFIDETQF
jgi:hypothetical protein